MAAKEIWYVWNSKGMPPVGVKKALCQGMVLIDDEHYFGSIDSAWDWFGENPFIQIYTLGETRERVACDCYGGRVLIDIDDNENELWDKCDKCQGRGYRIAKGQ